MRMMLMMLLLLTVWAPEAPAVVIDSGDGTGNTQPPLDDPGFDNVGLKGGLTVVYLGDSWVLTANHVGVGSVDFGGTTYVDVPGTDVRLSNGDGTFADLLMFAIWPQPPLPPLAIASQPPVVGEGVVMAGDGRNRGAPTSWDPNGPPPPGPIYGYQLAPGRTLRWGTNVIDDLPVTRVLGTVALDIGFDAGATVDEAQAVNGDSGGAVFALRPSGWELVGILFAAGLYTDQPVDTALYGNRSYAADLDFYGNEIVDVIATPEPVAGLPAGLLVLTLLARRREHTRRPDRSGLQRAAYRPAR